MSDELRVSVQLVYGVRQQEVLGLSTSGGRAVHWFGSGTSAELHEQLVRELNWIVADWQASRRNAEASDEQG